MLGLVSVVVGRSSRLLPAKWAPLKISIVRGGEMQGKFAFLMVTTLERLLLNSKLAGAGARPGAMQMLVVERNLFSILGALFAAVRGRLGLSRIHGVHFQRGDEIRIEGRQSSVILDGEMFEADTGRPIVLRPTAPVPFLRLAA